MKPRSTKRAKFKLRKSQIRRKPRSTKRAKFKFCSAPLGRYRTGAVSSGWMRNSQLDGLIRLNEKQPIRMKLPHQAGWETADLGEIAVLCALNHDEAVSSGWRKNICSLCYQAGWETADETADRGLSRADWAWSCLIRLNEKQLT